MAPIVLRCIYPCLTVFLDLSQRVVPTGWNYSHQGETRLRMRRRVGALSAWVAEHGGVPPWDPKRKGLLSGRGDHFLNMSRDVKSENLICQKFQSATIRQGKFKGCWFGKHYFRKMEGPRFGHTHTPQTKGWVKIRAPPGKSSNPVDCCGISANSDD